MRLVRRGIHRPCSSCETGDRYAFEGRNLLWYVCHCRVLTFF
jgi:hypothetical protein